MAGKNNTFEANHSGFAALLRGTEVQSMVSASAKRVSAQAGPGFESLTWQGSSRQVGIVQTGTAQARRRSSRDNVLLRSIEAGRVR